MKTAFYAQRIHLAKFGCPLFKDEICALPFGPVPSAVYDVLKLARGDQKEWSFHTNDALSQVSKSIGWDNERFSAKEQPDLDYLSTSDIQALDEAISTVAKMSFNEILSSTHGREWTRAFNNASGKKVMDVVKIAKEAGADVATLQYLKEYLEMESALG